MPEDTETSEVLPEQAEVAHALMHEILDLIESKNVDSVIQTLCLQMAIGFISSAYDSDLDVTFNNIRKMRDMHKNHTDDKLS